MDERARDPVLIARAAAVRAARAATELRTLSAARRDAALSGMIGVIDEYATSILRANAADMAVAEAAPSTMDIACGSTNASLARLSLSPAKLAAMTRSVLAVRALDDPCGRTLSARLLDETLELRRVSCPIGVVVAIVEARPDAVTQIASLALKSGNALILRTGKESTRTTRVLVAAMRRALAAAQVPPDALMSIARRDVMAAILELDDLIDLVIPRGSAEFVRMIQATSRVPVLGHAAGVCHIYVDAGADVEMAIRIVTDSKTNYPTACNAVEAVLVHESIAERLLVPLVTALGVLGVEVRVCSHARALLARGLGDFDGIIRDATDDDCGREYSDLVVALRIVPSIDVALSHIARYGSKHTEAIVTGDDEVAERFLATVDAANVFHNASTRFADGYRYGLGAEVGIATGKLHARGPVGLDGLVTYRYELRGSGQIVREYGGLHGRRFLHEKEADMQGQ